MTEIDFPKPDIGANEAELQNVTRSAAYKAACQAHESVVANSAGSWFPPTTETFHFVLDHLKIDEVDGSEWKTPAEHVMDYKLRAMLVDPTNSKKHGKTCTFWYRIQPAREGAKEGSGSPSARRMRRLIDQGDPNGGKSDKESQWKARLLKIVGEQVLFSGHVEMAPTLKDPNDRKAGYKPKERNDSCFPSDFMLEGVQACAGEVVVTPMPAAVAEETQGPKQAKYSFGFDDLAVKPEIQEELGVLAIGAGVDHEATDTWLEAIAAIAEALNVPAGRLPDVQVAMEALRQGATGAYNPAQQP